MRRTGLLGLLLICTLTTAMPVQAAAGAAIPPAAEETLESVTESNTGVSEEAAPAATVSEAEVTDQGTDTELQTQETETESEPQTQAAGTESEPQTQAAGTESEPQTQAAGTESEPQTQITEPESEPQTQVTETESEPQTQETDMSELTADPAEDPELKDELTQDGGAVLTEDSEQKVESEVSETPDEVEGAAAEEVSASNEETACAVSAENTVSSVSAKAAAGLAAEIDRIHFITLNGSYSDSDAILIESNGKYGLIDSSNPSKASSDPDFAFTSEYVDTAANGLTVVKYLTDLNISHLEFVLATHSHSDHVGGMADIAGSGLINRNTVYIYKDYQAVMGEREWHNDYYANLALEAMRAKNAILLNVLDPSSNALQALGDDGASLIRDSQDRVGDHLEFTMGDFLIRLFNLHTESSVNENLNSIVTAVKKKDSNSGALLMADMEQQHYMESRTVDAVIRNDNSFKADVYKAGHHGFYTSTSYDTLKTLKPANYVMTTRSTSSTVPSYTLAPYFAQKFGGKVYRTSENGPAVIAEFGDSSVTVKRLTKNKTTTTPVQWKPVVPDGWHMWYPNEDSYNRTGVKWSYFKSGAAVKGWFYIGSNWYHTDDNYILQTGWINVDGKRYLLNGNGVMQTGWTRYEGKWYYLHNNGVMHAGWIKDNGNWYYMGSDGAMRIGKQTVNGKIYLFDTHGVMRTGWANYAGKWYFLHSDGTMHFGWILSGGKWYYLGSDGTMQTGKKVIGGKTYLFSTSDGTLQAGWVNVGGKWYYANSDGTMHIGWRYVGGKWYYMGSDGTMQTGRKVLGGKTYFFSTSDGTLQIGWVYYAGKWYYTNSDGTMHIGWRYVGGNWYYFGSDGTMRVGRQTIGGKTYFFNASTGVMFTGWINYSGKWYYLNSDGSMHIGWRNVGGSWYYLGSDGTMRVGRQTISGKTYFFNFNTGVMLTGWINYSGKWYYLENNGVMAANKWIGDYYVKSNGEMAVNQWVGSYYVGADGKWIPGYKKAS